jgi:hypothetical protein
VAVEIGPGGGLCGFARQALDAEADAVRSLGGDGVEDAEALSRAVGRL